MGNLNKTLVYHLVDTLGIAAEIDTGRDAISGEGSFEIALGKLKVPFPLKITGHRGGTRELLGDRQVCRQSRAACCMSRRKASSAASRCTC